MKVCVYGVGAIGGVIAARLALNGVETSVVARGPHLAAIRERGLRLDTPEGSSVVNVTASDDAAALGVQDVVIAAVKAHSLPSIARGLSKLLRSDTSVVYAINGLPWWYFYKAVGKNEGRRIERLDPGGALWNLVGVERTIGCVVSLPSEVNEPGVIHYEGGNNRLALGELGGEQSSRLLEIAAALRNSGFTIDHRRPIREEVWRKLVHKIGASPIVVLTAGSPARSFDDAGIRVIARALYSEAFALAAAYGFPQNGNIDAFVDRRRHIVHRPSILQDLEAGRSMEIDPQLTVPIELAREAGVAVPTLEMLSALVRARARTAGLYNQ